MKRRLGDGGNWYSRSRLLLAGPPFEGPGVSGQGPEREKEHLSLVHDRSESSLFHESLVPDHWPLNANRPKGSRWTFTGFALSGFRVDGLLATMFRFLQWLLFLGAFAGLGLRASGAHFDDCSPGHREVSCCDGDASATDHSDNHCPDCPPVPHQHSQHHHGECCHASQWLPLSAKAALFPPWAVKSGLMLSEERPPDAPVLPLDKPPLI